MEQRNQLRVCSNLKLAALVLALFGVALWSGCRSTSDSGVWFPDPSIINARASNYATNSLIEGDVVSINFQYSTNYNTVQKIALDGTLNLEGAGQVKAAGKTAQQLQEELAKLYKSQVKDEIITVKVLAAGSCFYVVGAVPKPGKVPMERPMTVLEGIMEAGGFDPNRAKLSEVTVLRLEDGRQHAYRLDVGRMLRGQNPEPFYLKPFDIINVPLKTFNL